MSSDGKGQVSTRDHARYQRSEMERVGISIIGVSEQRTTNVETIGDVAKMPVCQRNFSSKLFSMVGGDGGCPV